MGTMSSSRTKPGHPARVAETATGGRPSADGKGRDQVGHHGRPGCAARGRDDRLPDGCGRGGRAPRGPAAGQGGRRGRRRQGAEEALQAEVRRRLQDEEERRRRQEVERLERARQAQTAVGAQDPARDGLPPTEPYVAVAAPGVPDSRAAGPAPDRPRRRFRPPSWGCPGPQPGRAGAAAAARGHPPAGLPRAGGSGAAAGRLRRPAHAAARASANLTITRRSGPGSTSSSPAWAVSSRRPRPGSRGWSKRRPAPGPTCRPSSRRRRGSRASCGRPAVPPRRRVSGQPPAAAPLCPHGGRRQDSPEAEASRHHRQHRRRRALTLPPVRSTVARLARPGATVLSVRNRHGGAAA